MLEGLRQLPVGNTALPFVRLFYGRQSRYLWEFDDGEIHYIPQGEGGEEGDAMMPLLYSLGQHRALQAVAEQMQEGEHLFAFLDDTIFVSSPLRVGPVYATLQESLNVHAGIQIHAGKTQIWNKAGVQPEVCNVLERVARISNPKVDHLERVSVALRDARHQNLGHAVGPPRVSLLVIFKVCWKSNVSS